MSSASAAAAAGEIENHHCHSLCLLRKTKTYGRKVFRIGTRPHCATLSTNWSDNFSTSRLRLRDSTNRLLAACRVCKNIIYRRRRVRETVKHNII